MDKWKTLWGYFEKHQDITYEGHDVLDIMDEIEHREE